MEKGQPFHIDQPDSLSLNITINIYQSSIAMRTPDIELPNLRLHNKSKVSYVETTCQLRKSYTSPLLDDYEKMAAKYKKYISDLGNTIGKVAQKQHYRNYLKQQQLNMIRSHLSIKKETLQKELQDKLDPTKSPNGKLHLEITSLTQLQDNYNSVLAAIQKNIEDKKRETLQLQICVSNQKSVLKQLLKSNFKQSKHPRLPIIPRNSSQLSFVSNQKLGNSRFRPSRESMISKLGVSIKDHTNQRLTLEQQKLIMLKLFIVYYKSTQLTQLHSKLIQLLEREVILREQSVKQIKRQLAQAAINNPMEQ